MRHTVTQFSVTIKSRRTTDEHGFTQIGSEEMPSRLPF